MSFFSKLFGWKKSTSSLSKTTEMLDEELYWTIVQESLDNSTNQDEQEAYLINRLKKLSPKEIIGFKLRTDKLLYDTYNRAMCCACYMMNRDFSKDGFDFFRSWVISKGKIVYEHAKNNPDSLITQVDENRDYYEFENFWYFAVEAFKQTTGKELDDFIDDEHFTFSEGNYPEIKFTWKEENPESMKAICPNLFEKMWK